MSATCKRKNHMRQPADNHVPPLPDHRTEVAAQRREKTRARLLDAALEVFSRVAHGTPSIEDVVSTAKVSRGTFYLYFQTLDEMLQALVQRQSDAMTQASLPVYEMLKEPCQRFAVGTRVLYKRAAVDPQWAAFMIRTTPLDRSQKLAALMQADLQLGNELGQFSFKDIQVAININLSTMMAGIGALGKGVPEPEDYMDECIRMALAGLGCSSDLSDKSVQFSRRHLKGWSWRRSDGLGSNFEEIQ